MLFSRISARHGVCRCHYVRTDKSDHRACARMRDMRLDESWTGRIWDHHTCSLLVDRVTANWFRCVLLAPCTSRSFTDLTGLWKAGVPMVLLRCRAALHKAAHVLWHVWNFEWTCWCYFILFLILSFKEWRPALFLIYISDLPNNINSTVWLFADDYVLYRDINKQSDPQELQEYLDELPCWEQD